MTKWEGVRHTGHERATSGLLAYVSRHCRMHAKQKAWEHPSSKPKQLLRWTTGSRQIAQHSPREARSSSSVGVIQVAASSAGSPRTAALNPLCWLNTKGLRGACAEAGAAAAAEGEEEARALRAAEAGARAVALALGASAAERDVAEAASVVAGERALAGESVVLGEGGLAGGTGVAEEGRARKERGVSEEEDAGEERGVAEEGGAAGWRRAEASRAP
ncbi:hypothetical protein AB1Y20_020473 [Prymnesium parvum]|uniref:Uncharacterized protein n=1 Tax=Prymnesium parvum TaxID=97485 RepID=A0AB34JVB7_PRYPA